MARLYALTASSKLPALKNSLPAALCVSASSTVAALLADGLFPAQHVPMFTTQLPIAGEQSNLANIGHLKELHGKAMHVASITTQLPVAEEQPDLANIGPLKGLHGKTMHVARERGAPITCR